MPTHIDRFRRMPDPKIAAAKAALATLSCVSNSRTATPPKIKITGENIEFLPRVSKENVYDYSWLPAVSDVGDKVDLIAMGFNALRRNSTRVVLCNRGWVHLGKSVYEYRGKIARK